MELQTARYPIVLKKGDDERHFSLRHGAPLQILDRECEWFMPIFDCRKAECGLCLVRITEGQEHMNAPLFIEEQTLRAMKAAPNERLACQTRVMGPMTVEIIARNSETQDPE